MAARERTRDALALGALAALCLAAFAQRRLGLANWSYWLDEAIEVGYVSGSLRDAIDSLLRDGTRPPLEDLVTFAAFHVGNGSESFLRLFPALWSSLSVLALFFAAGGTRRPARALGAALFLAATPLSVHLGQEVRCYALALFLLALAAALLTRERPPLVAAAIVSGLAALTLYLTVFPLAALWAHALAAARREGRLRRTFAAGALSIVGLVLWIALLRGMAPRMSAPMPTLADAAELLGGFFSGRPAGIALAAGAILPALLVGAGLLFELRRRSTAVSMLAAAVLGSGAFLVLFHVPHLRYFSPALVPAGLLAGTALEEIARRSRAGAVALAAAMVLAHLPAYREIRLYARPDWRQAAAYLAFRGPGEPIYAPDDWTYLALRVQPGVAGRVTWTPREADLAGVRDGWVVSSSFHTPAWAAARFGGTRPWALLPDAEDARIWRIRNGIVTAP